MSKLKQNCPTLNNGKEILENAYSLETPNDNKIYYKNIAAQYDKNFAKDLGYI